MELPREEVFQFSAELGTVTAKGREIYELVASGENLGDHGVVSADIKVEPANDFQAVFLHCERGTFVSVNLRMNGAVTHAAISPKLGGEIGRPETFKANPDAVRADIDNLVAGL